MPDPNQIITQAKNNLSSGYDNYTNQYKADNAALQTDANSQQDALLGQYKSAIGGQETQSGMASRLGGELGLPGLQTLANNANQAVNDLPRNQLAFAQQGALGNAGGNYSTNQLNGMIQQKLSDLAPIAQRATSQLQNAQGLLSTQMGYATADQQKQLQPFQLQQQLLSDRLARQQTGFTQEHQATLDALTAKANAGMQLSQAELQQAYALAQNEQSFHNSMALQSSGSAQSLANSKAMADYNNGIANQPMDPAYTLQLAVKAGLTPSQIQQFFGQKVDEGNSGSGLTLGNGYDPLRLNNNGGLNIGGN